MKNLNTIIISVLCSACCLYIYHLAAQRKITRLDNNYARLVAQTDQISASSEVIYRDQKISNASFVAAAGKAINAVVGIEAIKITQDRSGNDKYARTNGSGVLISSNGYIITNYHVIENASEIELILEDKREFKAELQGYDQSTDLALLKIDASDLPYIQIGDSDDLDIGEWVLAIGNPFKLSSSVTAGIVSAKARQINIFKTQGVESFIQTDAAVNPGNSGGALINTEGKLVGINTAILTYSGKYEGFSFAVPSNLVEKVITDLREYGAVQRAWLGVSVLSVDEKRAEALGLEKIEGVFVDLVEREGAADRAELKFEDVITAIDGKKTKSRPAFLEILGQYRPGDVISISYFRKGKTYQAEATLLNQLNTTDYIAVRRDKLFTELGFELRDLDSEEKEKNNQAGVMVVSIMKGSTIESVNMDPGYIITSINGIKINTVEQFKTKLESTSGLVLLNGFYENYPKEWPYKFYR